jgi:hypothetical protein
MSTAYSLLLYYMQLHQAFISWTRAAADKATAYTVWYLTCNKTSLAAKSVFLPFSQSGRQTLRKAGLSLQAQSNQHTLGTVDGASKAVCYLVTKSAESLLAVSPAQSRTTCNLDLQQLGALPVCASIPHVYAILAQPAMLHPSQPRTDSPLVVYRLADNKQSST